MTGRIQGFVFRFESPVLAPERDAQRFYDHLSNIAPQGSFLKLALSRSTCSQHGSYFKKLEKIRDTLEQMLLKFSDGKRLLEAITSYYDCPTLDDGFYRDIEQVLQLLASINKLEKINRIRGMSAKFISDKGDVSRRSISLRNPALQNLTTLNPSNRFTELSARAFSSQELNASALRLMCRRGLIQVVNRADELTTVFVILDQLNFLKALSDSQFSELPGDDSVLRRGRHRLTQLGSLQGQDKTRRLLLDLNANDNRTLKDRERVIKKPHETVERGNKEAKSESAQCYVNGQKIPQDKTLAVEWLKKAAKPEHYTVQLAVDITESPEVELCRKAAEQGHIEAQLELANRYGNGRGISKNEKQAVIWFRRAAEQGHPGAQYALAFCYSNGQGIPKDEKQAVFWCQQAAEQGNKDAHYALACCYSNGEGVSKDETQAAIWFKRAAEQGHPEAQYQLGICCFEGEGIAKDETQAAIWFKRAAEQGHPEAQYELAECYMNGEGISKDETQAVIWYRKAAELGLQKAQHNLAVCYENGEGIAKDETQAVIWFLKAAEQGHKEAQYELAQCYVEGRGIAKDETQAIEWYLQAAEKEHQKAQLELGKCYSFKEGFKDVERGFYWFLKAAENNSLEALSYVAICYVNGFGVTKDAKKAFEWFQNQHKKGDVNYSYFVGFCYSFGIGTEKNYNEALELLQKVAENSPLARRLLQICYPTGMAECREGNNVVEQLKTDPQKDSLESLILLGLCYWYGVGVHRDEDLAFAYYQKAADTGSRLAENLLKFDARMKRLKFKPLVYQDIFK